MTMDAKCSCSSDEELTPAISPREFCLWDEVTVRDFHQLQQEAYQDVSPCGAVIQPEVCRCKDVSRQMAIAAQQQLSPCRGCVKTWDEDEDDKCKKLPPWEVYDSDDMVFWDEDAQKQWDEAKRDIELGQVGVERFKHQGEIPVLPDVLVLENELDESEVLREEARLKSLESRAKASPAEKEAQRGPRSPSSRRTTAAAAATPAQSGSATEAEEEEEDSADPGQNDEADEEAEDEEESPEEE